MKRFYTYIGYELFCNGNNSNNYHTDILCVIYIIGVFASFYKHQVMGENNWIILI